jgi:hypothetical protein
MILFVLYFSLELVPSLWFTLKRPSNKWETTVTELDLNRNEIKDFGAKALKTNTTVTTALSASNIPQRKTASFYRRGKEMTDRTRDLAGSSAMVALTSGAGMGKSQCAIEFAWTFMECKPKERFVFWLRSAQEVTLQASYLEALEKLGGEPAP